MTEGNDRRPNEGTRLTPFEDSMVSKTMGAAPPLGTTNSGVNVLRDRFGRAYLLESGTRSDHQFTLRDILEVLPISDGCIAGDKQQGSPILDACDERSDRVGQTRTTSH